VHQEQQDLRVIRVIRVIKAIRVTKDLLVKKEIQDLLVNVVNVEH
jgi:hypothetical protein